MKNIAIAFSLFTLLSSHACNKNAGSMSDPLNKKWVFQQINGENVSVPDGFETPWLQLAGDQLTGFGGCNSLMGEYKLGSGSLSFPRVGSTKKYCEATQSTENAIKQALGAVDGYKMEGGLLKLMGGGKELAALKGE